MARFRAALEAAEGSIPDPRFFAREAPVSLARAAEIGGAELPPGVDATRIVRRASTLAHADGDSVAYLTDRRYLADLLSTAAGACFVTPAQKDAVPDGCVAMLTPEPLAGYAHLATLLHPPRRDSAVAQLVHPSADLEAGVELGPNVVVGSGAQVGAGTVIGAGAVIGPGVAIGRDCRIGGNAVIGFALIGDRVRILAGAVIGEAGFGVAESRGGAIDVPQLGRVIIQDGVTIGANSCVDRGAYDDTVIGENSKIDNLVQVAHNVRIGRSCVLAAHTGLSGSVTVGDGAMFGGRAGIADHLSIGVRARIAAAAGVMHDVPDGEVWAGTPARPIKRFMREVAWLTRQAGVRRGGGEA